MTRPKSRVPKPYWHVRDDDLTYGKRPGEVDKLWSMPPAERKLEFIDRAARGARKQLEELERERAAAVLPASMGTGGDGHGRG